MPIPISELVARMVEELDANQREQFEERAAIMEYDALYSRQHAECLALLDLYCHPEAIPVVTVIEVDMSGSKQWIATTDPDTARQHVADIGGIEISVRNVVL